MLEADHNYSDCMVKLSWAHTVTLIHADINIIGLQTLLAQVCLAENETAKD